MSIQLQNQDVSKSTISIAMCTFNGADYLQEQLVSIAKQTRLPDELVVCDDGSTDSTLQILDEFKKKVLFPVIIHCNKKRLGATKNFEKVITLCKGEIIVLCDQDDVWLPQKLEKIEELFKENPNAGYIFSDGIIVNEKLQLLNFTLWERFLFTKTARKRFEQGHQNQVEILIHHNVVTGATMAFRKNLKDLILPIPKKWVHDEWIALLASAVGASGIFVDEPLIKYRLHDRQLIGIGIGSDKKFNLIEQFKRANNNTKAEFYKNQAEGFIYISDQLNLTNKVTKETNKLFEGKIAHLQARQWLHGNSRWKRPNRVFTELINGRYHRFSNGWKSVIKDLCL